MTVLPPTRALLMSDPWAYDEAMDRYRQYLVAQWEQERQTVLASAQALASVNSPSHEQRTINAQNEREKTDTVVCARPTGIHGSQLTRIQGIYGASKFPQRVDTLAIRSHASDTKLTRSS